MAQYGIEQLQFFVEVFDERGELIEVLARLHDLDPLWRVPAEIFGKAHIYLCQGGRILRRSDRDDR